MGTTKYSMSENLSSFDVAQWDVSHTFVWFIIHRVHIGTQRVRILRKYFAMGKPLEMIERMITTGSFWS